MYVTLNDIKLFYKVKGAGQPLIMIHGNTEDHHIFDVLAANLKKHFKVYMFDSRGHGKSSEVDTLDYTIMAHDLLKFIQVLAIDKPAVLGFSDGGIIALHAALIDEDVFSKLILCGINTSLDGLKDSFINAYKDVNTMYNRLMFDMVPIDLKALSKLQVPIMLIEAEDDLIKPEHTKILLNTFKNVQYHYVLNHTHESYVVDHNYLYPIILSFMKIESH